MQQHGFYSYDAASVDEDPVKRWIGREVKRFLAEAHIHLPFLLRVAHAPVELVPDSVQQFMNSDDQEEMDLDDDAFAPSADEIRIEEDEVPQMMSHADMWDRFRAWVFSIQEPWTSDDDDYREQKAVEYFNHLMACSRDLLKLKPTLQSWVPHVSCFVASRQIKWLGRGRNRSADACESYGALVKHLIKHRTCRRRVRGDSSAHTRGVTKWQQTFTTHYIKQAFSRCCVKEKLLHGKANEPFLQRHDWRLKAKGVKKEKVQKEKVVSDTVRLRLQKEVDNDCAPPV